MIERVQGSISDGDEDLAGAQPLQTATVCTCVVDLGSRVCFATYNEDTNEMMLEESPCNGNDLGILAEKHFALVRPNLLLLGRRIVNNAAFLEALMHPIPGPSNGGDHDATGCNGGSSRSMPYRVLKSGAFDSRVCMPLIVQKLRVLSLLRKAQQDGQSSGVAPTYDDGNYPYYTADNQRAYPVSNYHMLGTLIDFSSEVQIKCVGALVSFLQTTIFRLEADETVTLARIVHTQSSMYMNLSESAIESLHIFSTEHHPLVAAKGRGNSKEGFSIFSLLDRTCSRGGREMLKHWMLKPLLNRDEIMMRLDGVELFAESSLIDSESMLGLLITLLQEIGEFWFAFEWHSFCTHKSSKFFSVFQLFSSY
jgi:MutS domain III